MCLILMPPKPRSKAMSFNILPAVLLQHIIVFSSYTVVLMATSGCEQGEAMLELDSHVFTVEYKDGGVNQKTIVLKNTGGQVIKIVDISPSCSCTVPKLTQWTLAPGERTELILEVTSPDLGDQDVEVAIHTNSLKTPVETVSLHLHGPPLSLPQIWKQPPVTMIRFPELAAFTTQIELSTLEAAGSDPWILNLIADTNIPADVTSTLIRVDNDSIFGKDIVTRTYTFELEIQPKIFERFSLQLRIVAATSDTKTTLGNPSLICDPAPPIRCLPQSLHFTRNAETTSDRILVLSSDDDEPFEVDLDSNLPFCSIKRDGESEHTISAILALRIAIDWEKVPDSQTGPFQLALKTSHPKCEVVNVTLDLAGTSE